MLIIILIIASGTDFFGQEISGFKTFGRSADLMEKGDVRYSLFSKAEYGLTDKMTLSIHPLWIFMAPSVDVKWQIKKSDKNAIAIVHGISSPTPVMKLVAAEGTGGLISPEFDIPFMLSVKNGLISTWHVGTIHRMSAELNVKVALFNSKLLPGSSIDLPVISPRNAVYYKNAGLNLGLVAEGVLLKKTDYYTGVQLFLFPFEDNEYKEEYPETGQYFGEWTTMIFYNTGTSFKIGAGTRLCYGDYPFGTQWHLLPQLDFVKPTLCDRTSL